jgi:hypothetical protein
MSSKPPPLPVSASVFFLNPKNDAFVNGQAGMPDNENPPHILVLKLVGTGVCVVFCGYWLYKTSLVFKMEQPPPLIWPILLTAFLGAVMVYATYWAIVPIVRNRRFQRSCQVLFGELTECKRVESDETVDWRVRYRFLSPLGHWIEGKWTTEGTVTKVEDRFMPNPGVRIAIAYIDDKTHRML